MRCLSIQLILQSNNNINNFIVKGSQKAVTPTIKPIRTSDCNTSIKFMHYSHSIVYSGLCLVSFVKVGINNPLLITLDYFLNIVDSILSFPFALAWYINWSVRFKSIRKSASEKTSKSLASIKPTEKVSGLPIKILDLSLKTA